MKDDRYPSDLFSDSGRFSAPHYPRWHLSLSGKPEERIELPTSEFPELISARIMSPHLPDRLDDTKFTGSAHQPTDASPAHELMAGIEPAYNGSAIRRITILPHEQRQRDDLNICLLVKITDSSRAGYNQTPPRWQKISI